ncbi:lactadherin-like [Exaiptasia diaphana]|uniref:F5/8 type C domain-containing protein n=1 Tax=Exaiptasia diaphana TaxID=2652724 RepID=A0A913YHN7_EXADI|nr:lactadherin-like [Exaiptasia diaphana]
MAGVDGTSSKKASRRLQAVIKDQEIVKSTQATNDGACLVRTYTVPDAVIEATNLREVPMTWYETPSVVALAPGGAWVAKTSNKEQFLIVDFGQNVKVIQIATQGRQEMDRWVKKYKVSYREEGKHTTYKTVQNEEDEDKVFIGNTDRNGVVTQKVGPFTARYVQINPTEWHINIEMRVEFYGCFLSDRYVVTGRNVHMDFVQEFLRDKKSVNFDDEQERPNN